jgi:putative transposase
MISLHDQRYNMRERDMAISFKGAHFPPEVILMGVRWYVAYPLSTRHVEERFCRKITFSRVRE